MSAIRIPRLAQAVLVVVAFYVIARIVFEGLLGQLIPASLMTMYLFFVIAGVFMVFTFTEDGTRELVAPIKALVEDPAKHKIRNVVFVVLPLAAALLTFNQIRPSLDAPLELRSIHPAPPSTVRSFDKRFDLLTLENPYRKFEREDPGKFEDLVAEGAAIYAQNCHFCHGDKLDGNGPMHRG